MRWSGWRRLLRLKLVSKCKSFWRQTNFRSRIFISIFKQYSHLDSYLLFFEYCFFLIYYTYLRKFMNRYRKASSTSQKDVDVECDSQVGLVRYWKNSNFFFGGSMLLIQYSSFVRLLVRGGLFDSSPTELILAPLFLGIGNILVDTKIMLKYIQNFIVWTHIINLVLCYLVFKYKCFISNSFINNFYRWRYFEYAFFLTV